MKGIEPGLNIGLPGGLIALARTVGSETVLPRCRNEPSFIRPGCPRLTRNIVGDAKSPRRVIRKISSLGLKGCHACRHVAAQPNVTGMSGSN
jgi:hypothetical protein